MPDPELLRILRELAPKLKAEGVTSLRLFGSGLHGTLSKTSDVDILVEFDRLDSDLYFKVLFMLEDALGRTVDLVMPETLNSHIRDRVLGEALDVA